MKYFATTRKKSGLFLLLLFFIGSSSVTLWPWMPKISKSIQNTLPVSQLAQDEVTQDKIATAELNLTQGAHVVIPKIDVASPIYEGETEGTLNKGVWRLPQSANPDIGSNTVLTAHRFQYTFGPQTFYHLDTLEKGDTIYVYWRGKEYTYSVATVFEVSDDALEIEGPTQKSILTLYTCDLLNPKKRLVVQANLVGTLTLADPDEALIAPLSTVGL